MSKSKTKVAIVSNTAWSIYNFRLGLIRSLLSKEFEIIAIAPYDEYASKLVAEGVKFVSWKLENYSNSLWSDIRSAMNIYGLYRKHRFDLVLHYTIKPSIYGGIASWLTNTPYYMIITGAGRLFSIPFYIRFVVKKLFRFASSKSEETWFLNSEDLFGFINRKYLTRDHTFLLPSEGIDTKYFYPNPLERRKNVITFLFAGRLLRDKGIYEFIQASSIIQGRYSNVSFEVVGFTNPKDPNCITLNELEEYQKKGWIHYHGSHEDVRPYLQRCDCVVFPSYYGEGVSRILLEACSMAIPCITTDHVGCRDVIRHNYNGIVIPPKSIIHLVNGIEYFLSLSTEDKIKMGNHGRNLVKTEFEEERIVEIYMKKIFFPYNINSNQRKVSKNSIEK